MNRRGPIFGIVFLLMGIILLAAISWEYDHRTKSEAQYADEHPLEWPGQIYGLSGIEEGAGWTGMVSIVGGLAMLAIEGFKAFRRRPAQ